MQPKFVAPADPAAQWTGAAKGPAFFAYSANYLIDTDHAVIVDVEATRAIRQAEVGAARAMIDRTLVLDGIPRTAEQARIMDDHIEVLQIIHLICHDENAMIERLRRRALEANRHDDADEDVIRKRWRVYEAQTYPVLDHYPKNLVSEVDSIGSLGRILHDILEHVVPVHDKHFPAFGS